jgi:hypothetical protein
MILQDRLDNTALPQDGAFGFVPIWDRGEIERTLASATHVAYRAGFAN